MKRRILFLLLLSTITGWVCFHPNTIQAAYPEKAVTFIVVFPAGGGMDITARALTEAVKKHFPKPMVVVNRPGAAGTIGTTEIIQAKPDGYTIGMSAVAVLTIQPHRTKLPYGSPDDYTPIIKVNSLPIVFAVRTDSPWKTMKEVIEYARANPGKLRVGHPGIGTVFHLSAEMLGRTANVDLTAVPFAGGAESVPAFLGGHVETLSVAYGEIVAHVKAEKVRILAVFAEKRNPYFPDVPTIRETGYNVMSLYHYHMVIGPKGLSPEIVVKLHDTFKKAMGEPAFIAAMKARGFLITYEGSEDLKRRLKKDYEQYAKLVDMLKLKGK